MFVALSHQRHALQGQTPDHGTDLNRQEAKQTRCNPTLQSCDLKGSDLSQNSENGNSFRGAMMSNTIDKFSGFAFQARAKEHFLTNSDHHQNQEAALERRVKFLCRRSR